MNALLKVLAILGFLILTTQTVRHGYQLWISPRTSMLDRYEPLKGEISAATSLDELVQRYDKVHKEAEQARQARARDTSGTTPDFSAEPYKSETALQAAIRDWEEKSSELRELRFYWSMGVVLAAVGLWIYRKGSRWFGLVLMIAGITEIIYATCPSLLGATREFDRLLVNKFVLSAISLALMIWIIRFLGIFTEKEQPAQT